MVALRPCVSTTLVLMSWPLLTNHDF